MKEISKYLYPALIILAIMGIGYFTISGISSEIKESPADNIKGVERGSEYQATNTANMEGGAKFAKEIYRQVASTTPTGWAIVGDGGLGYSPILGSVIVTSSTPGQLRIFNATSTTDKGSTTVAVLNNSDDGFITPGTYIFDLVMTRGISLIFENGFWGAYTITWR